MLTGLPTCPHAGPSAIVPVTLVAVSPPLLAHRAAKPGGTLRVTTAGLWNHPVAVPPLTRDTGMRPCGLILPCHLMVADRGALVVDEEVHERGLDAKAPFS